MAAIQCEVPIVVISGTLAIDIAKFAMFATHAHENEQWSTLSRFSDAHECDPDFVCINSAMFKSKPDFSAAPPEGSSSCASKVAASMVEVHGGALIEAELLWAGVMVHACCSYEDPSIPC